MKLEDPRKMRRIIEERFEKLYAFIVDPKNDDTESFRIKQYKASQSMDRDFKLMKAYNVIIKMTDGEIETYNSNIIINDQINRKLKRQEIELERKNAKRFKQGVPKNIKAYRKIEWLLNECKNDKRVTLDSEKSGLGLNKLKPEDSSIKHFQKYTGNYVEQIYKNQGKLGLSVEKSERPKNQIAAKSLKDMKTNTLEDIPKNKKVNRKTEVRLNERKHVKGVTLDSKKSGLGLNNLKPEDSPLKHFQRYTGNYVEQLYKSHGKPGLSVKKSERPKNQIAVESLKDMKTNTLEDIPKNKEVNQKSETLLNECKHYKRETSDSKKSDLELNKLVSGDIPFPFSDFIKYGGEYTNLFFETWEKYLSIVESERPSKYSKAVQSWLNMKRDTLEEEMEWFEMLEELMKKRPLFDDFRVDNSMAVNYNDNLNSVKSRES